MVGHKTTGPPHSATNLLTLGAGVASCRCEVIAEYMCLFLMVGIGFFIE